MSSFKKRYCLKQRFGKHLCQIQHFKFLCLFVNYLVGYAERVQNFGGKLISRDSQKLETRSLSRKCALLYKKHPFEVHIRQNLGILEILFANSAMLINCFNHPSKYMTNNSNSTKDIEPLFAFIFDNLVHGSL